jgi:hypothetical protein
VTYARYLLWINATWRCAEVRDLGAIQLKLVRSSSLRGKKNCENSKQCLEAVCFDLDRLIEPHDFPFLFSGQISVRSFSMGLHRPILENIHDTDRLIHCWLLRKRTVLEKTL